MANQQIEGFFERLYDHELNHKRHLDSADSLIIGIVGALLGVGAYYLSLIPQCTWCVTCFVYWVLIVGFFLSLAGGLFCCASSIGAVRSQYMSYIASPQSWSEYVDGLTKYHAVNQKGDEIENRVLVDLAPIQRKHYIDAGENIRKLVILKHFYQVWAKRCIFASVVLMMASALPVTLIQAGFHKDASKQVTTEDNNAVEQQKAAEPEKPKPPEIVVIREGDSKPQEKGK